jgi:hypothetical protein
MEETNILSRIISLVFSNTEFPKGTAFRRTPSLWVTLCPLGARIIGLILGNSL